MQPAARQESNPDEPTGAPCAVFAVLRQLPGLLLFMWFLYPACGFAIAQAPPVTFVSENINADTTWTLAGSPYVITKDIYVYSPEYMSPKVTLTVAPGVEIRFESGTGLYIGNPRSEVPLFGALAARGTAGDPIVFTSNRPSPGPGDWKGIYFTWAADSDGCVLEHCRVSYGGDVHGGCVIVEYGHPWLRANTFCYSSQAGVRVSGADPLIECNTFLHNPYGIYAIRLDNPLAVHHNNFVGSRYFGVRQEDGGSVDAGGNWWGDPRGPGYTQGDNFSGDYGGDRCQGRVDAASPLSAPDGCAPEPPVNTSPLIPHRPDPAEDATGVVLAGDREQPVTLSWKSGDPDTGDAVSFDVYFGSSPESLQLRAGGLFDDRIPVDSLAFGTDYYWRVTARDLRGAVVEGPLWHFATQPSPPPAVAHLAVDGRGDGTSVRLDWRGYDEGAAGSVARYRVYAETSPFSDVTGLEAVVTVPSGASGATVTSLLRHTPHWFAVVPVGPEGFFARRVSSVSAMPEDVTPPPAPCELSVQSLNNTLVFSWLPGAGGDDDLAGYRVFFGGDSTGERLPAQQTTYRREGLSPATGYGFRVLAMDGDGNCSQAVSTTGVTLLPNPAGLEARGRDGYAELDWQPAAAPALVSGYRVYVSREPFDSVAGMPPALETRATAAGLAGLVNDRTYHVAVTAVNLSGGETPGVHTVAVVPSADRQGPEITAVRAGGLPLADGFVLRRAAEVSLSATDPSGIARVEFFLDGVLLGEDHGDAPYGVHLDPLAMSDAPHRLTITAADTLGNTATVSFAITTALDPPPAPTIARPSENTFTGQPSITVSGTAAAGCRVVLFNGGLPTGTECEVDQKGTFSVEMALAEGPNRIQAAARNRAGTGPLSDPVTLTLDTGIPVPPQDVTAESGAAGRVRLKWRRPADGEAVQIEIRRSEQPFESAADARVIASCPASAGAFEDLPPEDGTWYYRLALVDAAGNRSALSDEVTAVSDGTPPRAERIDYFPQGPYDAETGRIAPGLVDIRLTVSEPLQAAPFLSICPDSGSPVNIALRAQGERVYTGMWEITGTTPTGTAWAVFSGRDRAGNRGTDIDAGATVRVDTRGPRVTRLALQPAAPIKNDAASPATVAVVFGLDEPVRAGTRPVVSFSLSGPGREAATVGPVSPAAPGPGEAQAWRAEFVLPADAGQLAPESLSFGFDAVDDLGNPAGRILAQSRFQVYQGQLPPLAVPRDLSGASLPAGRIRLAWQAVTGAAGYRLYRRAPGESELTPYRRVDDGVTFIDEPDRDGPYRYAVASIRREAARESESDRSAGVAVRADRRAPAPPHDLTLELTARGIRAAWQAAPEADAVTFRLYRSDQAQILNTRGLSPVAEGVSGTTVIDGRPSATAHTYAVTAVDAAGNESAPSASVYLNAGLLPVSGISVEQVDDGPPRVRWTHPGGDLAGFDIYLGTPPRGLKLNESLLTAAQYVDGGCDGGARTYSLVAVDRGGHPSLARGITLPPITVEPAGVLILRRGVMNRLEFVLKNRGARDVPGVRLRVGIGDREHLSAAVDLPAGESVTLPVPVGGYADLPDVALMTVTVEIDPNPGEVVRIVRHHTVEVGQSRLVLQLLNEKFTRGGHGSLRFSLENTGPGEIELVTATRRGRPSADIALRLLDEDGNVLATAPFTQALGAGVATLAGGDSVARIPAGGTFTSAAASIAVPAAAPDHVSLALDIAHLYYHHGRKDEVRMHGPATTRALTLADTSYDGEITDVAPRVSDGDRDIVIRGRAVERASGDPLAGVALKLVVTLDGFERSAPVMTGEDGSFTYLFHPVASEGGTYSVRAVHPEVSDRPVQDRFVIRRLTVTPARIDLSVPRNYEKNLTLEVAAGSAVDAAHLHLVYAAADQPSGTLAPGIHVSLPDPLDALPAGRRASLSFSLWADNTAPETGTLVLRVADDHNADWGRVTVRTHFSEAGPALFFSPDHVETGVALADSVTAGIVLENRGLAPLSDVTVELVSQAGNSIPAWARLNSPAEQGSLAVGDRREIGLSFSPDPAAAEGRYAFYLRVRAAQIEPTDIGVYVAVTQDGEGGVLFKVADLYTGTQDGEGRVVQGLSGARVRLQNEAVPTVSAELVSDDQGEALFRHLPAGRYRYRVTAPRHQEQTGRVWVRPGITAGQAVFLEYDLVTVEWQVSETTISDRYDLVLKATYETEVPAPVVTAEPASVTLPDMRAGDVYNGEFTLVNHGLVRADGLSFRAPPEDGDFAWELMAGLPDHLDAAQRVTVAYRIICLRTPGAEGTGGGTCRDTRCVRVGYQWICANGHCSRSAVYHCFSYNPHECGGPGGETVPVPIGGPGGYGSASVSSPASPPATAIAGPRCFPKPVRRKCLACSRRDTDHDRTQEAFGTVDLVMRQYNRDARDLRVKVPGGAIEVRRQYYDDAWHWEHRRHNLVLRTAADGGLCAIESAGVVYEAAASGSDVFVHGVFRITRKDDGYRWSDPRGNWKRFDDRGRLTAYGTRLGTLARLIYEADRLSGVADRNDRQVLWYDSDDDGRIVSVSDAAGRKVAYAYEDGRLAAVTDVLGTVSTCTYDGRGRLVRVTDGVGRSAVIAYDAAGNVTSVADGEGTGWSFEYGYDAATKGTDVSIRNPGGRIRQVWYNRRGETERVQLNGRDVKTIVQDGRNLIVTDEVGNITRKAFDEWGNLTRMTYPDGSTVSWKYEHLFNHLTEKTDERGIVTRYDYDDAGNLTRKTEAADTEDERVTEYTFDADGHRLSRRLLPDGQTEEALTTYRHDEEGNVSAVTDAEGHTTTMTYDIAGNLLTRTDAAGRQWRYVYDAAGRLTDVVDPAGHATRYAYDPTGNRVSWTDALGHQRTFAYDHENHLVQRTNASGDASTFDYNADGRMTRHTDAEGRSKRFEYDAEGRLTASFDGGGNTVSLEYGQRYDECSTCTAGGAADKPSRMIFPTFIREYRYDARGRRTVQKDFLSESDALTSLFEYDAAGNRIARTDPQDRTTRYAYDALNRLVSVIDAAAGETRYRYDSRDNLIELTDAAGRTTRFSYDRLNHLVSETRPMGQQIQYRYDETGALAEKIDALGLIAKYTYDPAGKLVLIQHFPSAGETVPAKSVHFTYDAVGNRIAWNDGTTSAVCRYDANNRKISETVDYGAFQLTMTYEYYRNGLKKRFTAPDGTTCRYRYDDANRLAEVEIPGQGSITFTAYTWNRPAGVLFPGGGTQTRTYDALMRLAGITVKDPAQNPLMRYRYAYDRAGNITSRETMDGTTTYSYDELNRLTEAQNPTLPDESYTYDPVGNRLTSAATPGTWTYNDNDELETAGDITYEYDANGSMIRRSASDSVTRFFYNLENRLSRVEDQAGAVIATYAYDPFGRRLWKEVDGTRTWFVYSDEGLVGEYTAAGTPIRIYGYKPNTIWTTDPLFLKTNGHYYFYQNDHLGTPQQLTAPNGATVWSATYMSSGRVTFSISTKINSPIRFPGQYYDTETRDHYNFNRFYSPNIGRYLQADPLGFSGGINLFAYVSNNFVNKADPYGLEVIALPENTEWPDLPNQPIIGYNYCGPGNNGRMPTNMLDQACREHDECYDRCGISSDNVSISCPGQDRGPSCQDDCDDALCEAAGIHGGWIRLGVRYLFCD